MGLEAVLADAPRIMGDGPTYVFFDIDKVDPAFAPGKGRPEVGGMQPQDLQTPLRDFSGLNLVDGCCVAPEG